MAPITRFPDPRLTGPEGILAVGGDMDPQSLLLAYRQGIFPWPVEDVLCWFCPENRAVLDFKDLHVSRTLLKQRKRSPLTLTIDRDFDQVIEMCADTRREEGTWITDELLGAYQEMHRLGFSHSAEAWLGDELVGGVYGVEIDGVFSAESMFYLEPYASKLALLHLIEWLKGRSHEWIDIQQLTPHMEKMGAKLISRDDFLTRLAQAHARFLQKNR